MTVTNTLYKQENGEIIDADETNSDKSFILNNMLTYALDAVTSTSQKNILVGSGTPTFSSATNALITDLASGKNALFCYVYDNHDDASLDTTKWTDTTTGSGDPQDVNSEHDGYMQLYATSASSVTFALKSVGSGTALDFKSFSGNSECVVRLVVSTGHLGGSGSRTGEAAFQISDGTNHVNLIYYNLDGGARSQSGIYNLLFNKGSSQVRMFKDSVEVGGSPFSLSTLGANWYLRAYAKSYPSGNYDNRGAGNVQIYHEGYIEGTSGTSSVYTSATTITASTIAISRLKSDASNESSFSIYGSANGGSNYTQLNHSSGQGILTSGLTSGTSGKLRFDIAVPTSVSTTTPLLYTQYKLNYAGYFS